MNRTRSTRDRIKARIPEMAMVDLANDIDAAIRDRDVVRLAAFAAEAELTAGMDQQASRAREILALLETAMAKAGARGLRVSLSDLFAPASTSGARVKAAPRSGPQPDIAAMIRAADREMLARGGPFDRDTSEALELERAREMNRQLAVKNEQAERARREQIEAARAWQAEDEGVAKVPWWRRG